MSISLKRKMSLIMALLLSAAALFTTLPMTVDAEENTVNFEKGNVISYGSYRTTKMSVDGGTGIAYCAEPYKRTPGEGGHSYTLLGKDSHIRRALYYLQGGPKFDTVKDAWFSGWSDDDIYVIGHLVVSYLYDGYTASQDAFYGAPEQYKSKAIEVANAIREMEFPPDDFQAFIVKGEGRIQTMVGCWFARYGWIELWKSSADLSITKGNGSYSLEGAEYGIYYGDDKVETLTTNADGYAKSGKLEPGSYIVRELKESKGYKLDTKDHEVKVTADVVTAANVKEAPKTGWIELRKTAADTGVGGNNKSFSLKGAEYGIFLGDHQVATLVTDEKGYAKSDVLGIGNYTIKELKAPAGYALDVESHEVTVTDGGTSKADVTEKLRNYPVDILVKKIDSETKSEKAQGSASLEGAEFTVKFYETVSDTDPAEEDKKADRTWVLKTDENGRIKLDKDYLVSGDKFYTDADGRNILPVGTVTVKEKKAPDGYLLNDEVFVLKLAGDEKTDTVEAVHATSVPEQVHRGDLEFDKVSEGDQKKLAGIPFTITSKTTGESHTIVSDENGHVSTSASQAKHTANTNAGKTSKDGIWFGSSEPDDSKGALIYDTYVIEELRCEANKGLDLVRLEAEVQKDNVTVRLGTVVDKHINISTTALEPESGTHYAKPSGKVTIVDTVSYKGLKEGKEYKLVGTLMDQESGEVVKDADGKNITAETTFMPEKSSGKTEVTFTFDASALAGRSTVVFEDLYYENQIVTTHADLNDEDQTVHFPEIGTTATNDRTGTHKALAEKEVTLTDVVYYRGLAAGKTYTVTGTLMDRETGKELEADGEKVMAETEFTPEKSEGTVELRFTFDGRKLAGKSIVAFESVKEGKNEIAVHADLEDEDQTVHFPEIGTKAVNDKTGNHTAYAEKEVALTDTVSYKGLEAGKTYTVTGTLMDKKTGEPLTVNGEKVVEETEFTAENSEGTVEIHFTFDGSALAGGTIVVFESVKEEQNEIAVHADIEDEDQSIDFPGLHTSAKDKTDGDQTVEADRDVKITDTVKYTNLVKGEKYMVTGTLMDKETGKPLQNDGKDVTAEAEFTAEKSDGSVDVTFAFNTADLDGHDVVAFEELKEVNSGTVIADHKDLEDKDQTVSVKKEPEKTDTPDKDTPDSGSPKGSTVSSSSPKTGDDSHIILWCAVASAALLAGAGLAASVIRRRRGKNGK